MPDRHPIERAFAFACRTQTARGTPNEPTLADHAVRVAAPFDVGQDWVSTNTADGEQTGGKGTFPSSPPSGRIHTYPITRRVRGLGTAYAEANLPVEDDLLMAILGGRTVDATPGSETVTYHGVDDDEALLHCLAQTMGQEFQATDVVPRSASLEWEAGKHMMLSVELAGVGLTPTEQALEAATLDSVISPTFRGGTCSLGGVALTPIKGTLDFGLSVSEPILDGSTDGTWSGYKITERNPTGTLEVAITDLATFNPYTHLENADQLAWVLDLGAAQYRTIRIEADRLEITGVSPVNRGGVKAYSIEFAIRRATSPSVKDPVIIFK